MPTKKTNIQRPWVAKKESFSRNNDNSKFYNATKWRKFSKDYRNRNPECEMCKAQGISSPAHVCDHIRGLTYLLNKNLDAMVDAEVQSLCHKCHNKKSGKERHGYKQNKKIGG